jgi:hypothetical protein
MGLTKEANVFVGPAGQWLGGYVPAVLRSYPFSLGRVAGRDQPVVCIDEDSGLVVDETAPNAETFFDAAGNPSSTTNSVTEFLQRIEQDQTPTDLAVAALAEAHVLKPWALTVPVGEQQITVEGLYQVDEAALNRLDDASFLKLRKTSGLPVAYAQLLSTGQVSVLARFNLIQKQLLQSGQAAAQSPVSQ